MDLTTWSDAMLFSTVLIETELDDGEVKTGTGFFYFRRVRQSEGQEILVTNRHVVEGGRRITVWFHEAESEARPKLGEIGRVSTDQSNWRFHPDPKVDVAFMLMEPLDRDLQKSGYAVYRRNVNHRAIPTPEQLETTFPIEDVTVVGYPNGLYDEGNYLPIVRKGITATSLQVDYNHKPMFLISASVFPGSSGSPVYLHDPVSYGSRRGFELSPRLWFLGVVAEFKYREAKGWFEFDDQPILRAKVASQEALDLGVVFKERTIREALDHHLIANGHPPDDPARA